MRRSLWIASAAAIVVVVTAGLLTARPPRPAPLPIAVDVAAMPVLARNLTLADRIQIIHQRTVLNLERRGQMWCLAQDGGYPVRPEMAQRLIDQLLALRLTHPGAATSASPRFDDPADVTATGVRVLATSGASLGAVIVAAHPAGAHSFPAHQAGDPRDWLAEGTLDVATDPLAWVDTAILPHDLAISGAEVSHGGDSFDLDAPAAQTRLAALRALEFTGIRPAQQVAAAPIGTVAFRLDGGGTLNVTVLQAGIGPADAVWLRLTAQGPGADALHVAPGDWAFHYPAAALALLEPQS
jgi:hypothetical protein